MKCDNFLQRIHLKNKQKRINDMFEEEGLTDEILKKQLELNQERHKLDIPDENEMIDDFVQ